MTAPAAVWTPTEAAACCVDRITIRGAGPGRWLIRRISTSPADTESPVMVAAATIDLAIAWVCGEYGPGRCSGYRTAAAAAHVFVGPPR